MHRVLAALGWLLLLLLLLSPPLVAAPPVVQEISPMAAARATHQTTLLDDGQVLVLGGYDEEIRSQASAWLLRVTLRP